MPNRPDRHLGLANQSLPCSGRSNSRYQPTVRNGWTRCSVVFAVACIPTRNRAWSSSLPRINRRMRCSDGSSWKIFWSSFSSKVTTCLADSSWTCCQDAVRVPRPCGWAFAAWAFHRRTCLATLATELPPSDRVQASTSVRSELLVDLLVQVCLAGSCLFGTIVPPCRRRIGGAVPRAENLVDLITTDRYAIVMQNLATQWIQSYPCKTKTSQETQRSLQKFLEPGRKPKVINTDNSLEFGNACEDLSWNHCTSTPHRSETNGIAERAVRRVKEGTSAVLLQSGLNENWWADSMECYTYLRNIQDLLSDGETPHERRFGQPFKGPIIPFGSLVEYHPITAKDQSRIHQFGLGLFLGYALYAGVTYWLQTLRSWRRWTHQKSTLKRLNAKEVTFPKEKGEIIFPIANGRIKPLGGDQDLRTSTLTRDHPIRGESHVNFLGESEGSLPPPHDSFPDAGEAIDDFWSMSGNFIYRHHVEPRVKLYSPREESSPIPLKYIDVSRTTCTNLDGKQEKRIDDYWNVDGPRDLSDPWTSFTQFTLLEEKPPDGYMWSGWRLTRKQLTSRPDYLWPELWTNLGRNAKLKERQKWSHEKPQLDNARKLRGIYFIDPEDKEFKETIKNARKKLETLVAPAMPCKTSKNNQNWVTRGKTHEIKSKLVCILEASESTRLRMVESLPNHHEDHITGKGNNSLQHYNLVHKFILCLKAMKIPAAKAAVDKEWEKMEKFSAWNLAKVRSKKEVIDEARTSGAIQRSSCTPKRYCERWFCFLCSIHRTRIISFSNDSSKSHGYHLQIARLRGTSSWRRSAYTQVEMEDAPKFLKIPKSECPSMWMTQIDWKETKHWSDVETTQ